MQIYYTTLYHNIHYTSHNMVAGDQYRNTRICGIAVFDVVLTAVAAFMATAIFSTVALETFIVAFIVLIMIGIAAHVVVGQPTKLNEMLGLSGPRTDIDQN